MAKRVAKFHKVSYEQFKEAMIQTLWADENNEEKIRAAYESIKLPERKTVGSAGYDFHSPVKFTLNPGQTVTIPTGIRCQMIEDWVLKLYPRSSLGFKYRLWLDNQIGIIDRDYFYSDNEGHIMAKITNNSNEAKSMKMNVGDGFMQGIFVEYGITEDDDATGIRNGGFGHTDKFK